MSSSCPSFPSKLDPDARADALLAAARMLLPALRAGRPVSAFALRDAIATAFGGSDAEGLWCWRDAYDAAEAAQTLFVREISSALTARPPRVQLAMLMRIAALFPTQTRRSEASVRLQQYSTPLPLAFVAVQAALMRPAETLLEPSAGTGLLAGLADRGGPFILNDFASDRVALLARLFPDAIVCSHDAAQLHDRLDPALVPEVVLINPPFSAEAHVAGRSLDATFRHLRAALARLATGGRLVAITSAGFAPDAPRLRAQWARLQSNARLCFSATIDGAFHSHGTEVETRLSVFDKHMADFGAAAALPGKAADLPSLLAWVEAMVPPRAQPSTGQCPPAAQRLQTPVPAARGSAAGPVPAPPLAFPDPASAQLLAYEAIAEPPAPAAFSDALYEPFRMQSFSVPGAGRHPTALVQSAAMASVRPPLPSYRPHLPEAIVRDGLLSEPQLETVILAGEAHAATLAGAWRVDDTHDRVDAAPIDDARAVRFRRGFMLGDGTGAGKGRQVAAILLDNWLKGRRRALWLSKSTSLIEDAQRDWTALGQEKLLIQPLARFRPGTPVTLAQGILFTTYAVLRGDDGGDKRSRLGQIIDWLGRDFDGVIVFDESHTMQNAAGGAGGHGDAAPSLQGRAGLRLQHALPDARILYVSATGATTVQNLAYAQRLGLWGGGDFPFATRPEFVAAIESGGVAAMEVLARDLRALGLYTARSLSYDGVEYELVEHRLSPEQIRIYDVYADAFQIIHANLDAALEAAGVTSTGESRSGVLNSRARSAARSAFESSKQRFFAHLLTAMKTPTLIARIEDDLRAGHAAVIQLVSTGEALLDRRLADIPADEWDDVRIDVTPREYVLDYLAHAFPVQLYEPFTDCEGNLGSRPVRAGGQPVECREAVARRDLLIEQLASPSQARSTRSSSGSEQNASPKSLAAPIGLCAGQAPAEPCASPSSAAPRAPILAKPPHSRTTASAS